jgi:hypothetical protein
MRDTKLKTKTVMTVDLAYRDPQKRFKVPSTPKATIAIYCADLSSLDDIKYTVESFTFFDAEMTTQTKTSLKLTLADFLPASEVAEFENVDDIPAFALSADKLRDILVDADEQQDDDARRSRSPG